jgi:hypothetical protein
MMGDLRRTAGRQPTLQQSVDAGAERGDSSSVLYFAGEVADGTLGLSERTDAMPEIDTALDASKDAIEQLVIAGERTKTAWTSARAPGKWSPSQIVEHVAPLA